MRRMELFAQEPIRLHLVEQFDNPCEYQSNVWGPPPGALIQVMDPIEVFVPVGNGGTSLVPRGRYRLDELKTIQNATWAVLVNLETGGRLPFRLAREGSAWIDWRGVRSIII